MPNSRPVLLLGVALTALAPSLASAQTWPARPVTIVSPFAAGSGIGLLARNVGNDLSAKLGQPFIVEDRAGANGNVAATSVAKAEPDGHTLLIGTPGTLVQNKYVYKTMPFDGEKDFVLIVLVSKAPMLITINPKLPMNSLAELVAYAKAHPGKVNVAPRASARRDTSRSSCSSGLPAWR